MNKQAATGWGEIHTPEPELKYPEWMSTDYNRPRRHIKRRKRIDAERVTQIVMVVAMIAAVVVMAVAR